MEIFFFLTKNSVKLRINIENGRDWVSAYGKMANKNERNTDNTAMGHFINGHERNHRWTRVPKMLYTYTTVLSQTFITTIDGTYIISCADVKFFIRLFVGTV